MALQMNFNSASALAASGSYIRRESWPVNQYIFVERTDDDPPVESFSIHVASGTDHPFWLAPQADLEASDWVEVEN
jgi:hypothetical protein